MMDTPVLVFAVLGILLGFAQLLRRGGEVDVAQREQFTKMVKDLYQESRAWRSQMEGASRLAFQLALLRERTVLAHDLLQEILQECVQVKLPKALINFISEAEIDRLLNQFDGIDRVAFDSNELRAERPIQDTDRTTGSPPAQAKDLSVQAGIEVPSKSES